MRRLLSSGLGRVRVSEDEAFMRDAYEGYAYPAAFEGR